VSIRQLCGFCSGCCGGCWIVDPWRNPAARDGLEFCYLTQMPGVDETGQFLARHSEWLKRPSPSDNWLGFKLPRCRPNYLNSCLLQKRVFL
jgi:hypothetical protein